MMECKKCGCCCRAFGIVEIADNDLTPLYLTTSTELGYRRMKTFGFRCICLDEDMSCGIYEQRPSVCRNFNAGGELCHLARMRCLEY